jgi:hypothetical protein
MSPDELIELVKSGPTEKLVAGLAPLTDGERKKLAKTATVCARYCFPSRIFATRPGQR